MLSGPEISAQRARGIITIEPFNEWYLGANSYDLTLNENLLVYEDGVLDMAVDNPTKPLVIPETGFRLEPGELYLGMTNEVAGSVKHVPVVNGRSSTGRLGIFVHVTAGFGDIGFINRWTLEIVVTRPVIVYPGVRFCQISFESVQGPWVLYQDRRDSRYHDRTEMPVSSKLWRDFDKDKRVKKNGK